MGIIRNVPDGIDEVPENVTLEYDPLIAPEIAEAKTHEYVEPINFDVEKLPIETYIKNVDSLDKTQFTLARKFGFGGSDSSVLMGVNPYTTLEQLIAEKARDHLTEEEKEIGNKVAVRKGNDLEPLIISKCSTFLQQKVIKPSDMYLFSDFPYLKLNFDGVVEGKDLVPCEIKVVTARGERHYNPAKAIYSENIGIWMPLPENVSTRNWSLEMKAAHYGIPPYYYTQLQYEMMGLNSEYGYLGAMFDNYWTVHLFFAWADYNLWNDLKLSGYKNWQKVIALNPERADVKRSFISPTPTVDTNTTKLKLSE